MVNRVRLATLNVWLNTNIVGKRTAFRSSPLELVLIHFPYFKSFWEGDSFGISKILLVYRILLIDFISALFVLKVTTRD